MQHRESKLFIKSRFARRGIYWLPNLFTIMALCAGFYAIVQAMGGHYQQAAMAIFVALVLDGIDDTRLQIQSSTLLVARW